MEHHPFSSDKDQFSPQEQELGGTSLFFVVEVLIEVLIFFEFVFIVSELFLVFFEGVKIVFLIKVRLDRAGVLLKVATTARFVLTLAHSYSFQTLRLEAGFPARPARR